MFMDAVQDLTRREFELFRQLIYAQSGIHLSDEKIQLLRARLGKRLRAGDFRSYREYYEHVRNDLTGRELCELLDAVSTNTTHLFRESRHFEFLAATFKEWLQEPACRKKNPVWRIWSAGCSSGEEPYSIAMTVHNVLCNTPGAQLKILATDLSTRVLRAAQAGLYEAHRLGTVPAAFRHHYFVRAKAKDGLWMRVAPEIQALITFARFNLMTETFPFRSRFHFIFCRNVMIYFDRPTQEKLVGRFAGHLLPGGYLLIGHSESLNGIKHSLQYAQPTIYRKPPDAP